MGAVMIIICTLAGILIEVNEYFGKLNKDITEIKA